jgi:hypothetical protein
MPCCAASCQLGEKLVVKTGRLWHNQGLCCKPRPHILHSYAMLLNDAGPMLVQCLRQRPISSQTRFQRVLLFCLHRWLPTRQQTFHQVQSPHSGNQLPDVWHQHCAAQVWFCNEALPHVFPLHACACQRLPAAVLCVLQCPGACCRWLASPAVSCVPTAQSGGSTRVTCSIPTVSLPVGTTW